MRRALAWDGIIPQVLDSDGVRQPHLDEIRALKERVAGESDDKHFDIVVEGTMSEHSPAAYSEAGATWWIESMWEAMGEHSPVTAAYDRLLQGPPT
jgi:hypothetical protein